MDGGVQTYSQVPGYRPTYSWAGIRNRTPQPKSRPRPCSRPLFSPGQAKGDKQQEAEKKAEGGRRKAGVGVGVTGIPFPSYGSNGGGFSSDSRFAARWGRAKESVGPCAGREEEMGDGDDDPG